MNCRVVQSRNVDFCVTICYANPSNFFGTDLDDLIVVDKESSLQGVLDKFHVIVYVPLGPKTPLTGSVQLYRDWNMKFYSHAQIPVCREEGTSASLLSELFLDHIRELLLKTLIRVVHPSSRGTASTSFGLRYSAHNERNMGGTSYQAKKVIGWRGEVNHDMDEMDRVDGGPLAMGEDDRPACAQTVHLFLKISKEVASTPGFELATV